MNFGPVWIMGGVTSGQTDRQKVMYKSPPCHWHRWAQIYWQKENRLRSTHLFCKFFSFSLAVFAVQKLFPVSSTFPDAFNTFPCTELGSLEMRGAISHIPSWSVSGLEKHHTIIWICPSVCLFVCLSSTPWFVDRLRPNSVGRSGMV